MTANPLWEVIQTYMDDPSHRYPPRPADLARETGVTDQVISKWKSRPMLPSADQLARFSKGTGIPYLELLEAALRGKGYLPLSGRARFAPLMSAELVDALERQWREDDEGGGARAGGAAPNTPPDSGPDKPTPPARLRALPTAASKTTSEPSVNKRRRRQDEAAEASQDDGSMEPS